MPRGRKAEFSGLEPGLRWPGRSGDRSRGPAGNGRPGHAPQRGQTGGSHGLRGPEGRREVKGSPRRPFPCGQADAAGRQAENREELLERAELFRELARENQCYSEPRRFASPHTRALYFEGRDLDPDVEAYNDTRLEVVVMCGLPGVGKDRWIAESAAGWPVVSLDAIRKDLDIGPEENQGAVVIQAKELARGHLRQARPFVWNATNITRAMRRQLVELLRDYQARVRIVYVETAWDELLRQNRTRAAPVPDVVLRQMAAKLDMPTVTEVHEVEYVVR